jgi:hypothetical protein
MQNKIGDLSFSSFPTENQPEFKLYLRLGYGFGIANLSGENLVAPASWRMPCCDRQPFAEGLIRFGPGNPHVNGTEVFDELLGLGVFYASVIPWT